MWMLIVGLILFLGAHSVRIFAEGWRTRDIADAATLPQRIVGTSAMGELVAERLKA